MAKLSQRICSAEGCGRPYVAKGFCKRHYYMVRSHGRVIETFRGHVGCRVAGCHRSHKGRGYCATHLGRLRKHGSTALAAVQVESLPNEEWRPVPGYVGSYEVSSLGRVKSLHRLVVRSDGKCQPVRGGLIATPLSGSGYPGAKIQTKGRQRNVPVHVLVATVFCGPRLPGHEVNHINLDKTDNRAENLEWLTPLENTRHALRNGRGLKRGEDSPNTKLLNSDVLAIRAALAGAPRGTMPQLARRYGVSPSTIWRIKLRLRWSHI